jgi:tetratricopeptide (TPR) repeat protein
LDETASAAVTADREQWRRRVLAFTGLWLLLAGLLASLSYVVLVVVATAAMLLIALAVAGVVLLRRARIGHGLGVIGHGLGVAFGVAAAAAGRAADGLQAGLRKLELRRRARRAGVWAKTTAKATPDGTRVAVDRAGQGYAAAFYRFSTLTTRVLRSDPGRRALRLNERGAQLRRDGKPDRAVEQHRVALAMVRDLGDRQAEAMTLNNLALALAQGGADRAAVQHFEQALAVLRQLGDEEHEGQVIANLGLVHGRQGRSEEAVTLLNAALDKLPPESPAYRQVAEQLRRAS